MNIFKYLNNFVDVKYIEVELTKSVVCCISINGAQQLRFVF